MIGNEKPSLKEVLTFYKENGCKLIYVKRDTNIAGVKEWQYVDVPIENIVNYCTQSSGNYGVVLAPNIVVIDVDCPAEFNNHKKDGRPRFEEARHAFNDTFTVRSASGGYHVYYKVTEDLKDTEHLYNDGIDLRTCSNGAHYVVGPYSKRGNQKFQYEVEKYLPIAEANQAVLDFVKEGIRIKEGKGVSARNTAMTTTDSREYTAHTPRVIPIGARNDTLFKLSCDLHRKGLCNTAILSAITDENDAKCEEPLESAEIQKIVNSAISYETTGGVAYDSDLHVSLPNDTVGQALQDVVTLEGIEPREIEWLIDGLIPKNCTSLIGADGGSGKSYFWMSLFASLSSGSKYFFSDEVPEPQKIMFFSSEDPLDTVVVPRLQKMGANLSNIISISDTSEVFTEITFNSRVLEELIKTHKPTVVVFDPIQSFVGSDINMGAQNQMRNMLQPLKRLEQLYSVTFIIVCHTNKRNDCLPRERLSNSGDIWDIARSVIMMGRDLDGHTFVSREKGNYSKENHYSFLYDIIDGVPTFYEYSDKTYFDFMYEKKNHVPEKEKKTTKIQTAKDLILKELNDSFTKSAPSTVLEARVKDAGISEQTFKNAKAELARDNLIKSSKMQNIWYTVLVESKQDDGVRI